jgi:hypothetical protein
VLGPTIDPGDPLGATPPSVLGKVVPTGGGTLGRTAVPEGAIVDPTPGWEVDPGSAPNEGEVPAVP